VGRVRVLSGVGRSELERAALRKRWLEEAALRPDMMRLAARSVPKERSRLRKKAES
jgi:hypothetical protein